MFAAFSFFYLNEPRGWNHALGFSLIALGRFSCFSGGKDRRNAAQKLMLVLVPIDWRTP